jgi:uncharacterized membrane protein
MAPSAEQPVNERPVSLGSFTTEREDADRVPASENIQKIAALERDALLQRSAADRLSSAVTRFTGSSGFAIVHALFFAVWLIANSSTVTHRPPFDPYPFSFLTLVVSLEAIFLSVFVLMSQNQMTRQADKRAHLDLQIDLLAEQELTVMLYMLRRLCDKKHITMSDQWTRRLDQLLKDTDVQEVAANLDADLPSN